MTRSVAALLVAALLGCAEPPSIELVAIRGCGLEQEFSGLRVRVIGDFPASAGTELLLGPGERGTIPKLPEDATGVAAEGLFGTTVTAIGRSYGIDPSLARGRVAGIDGEDSALAVFFAAPDSACELESQPSARTEVAAAVGPVGDVLIAGGVDPSGDALEELVHVDLLSGELRTLAATLPSPRRGASVHALPGRRFLLIGGAGPGGVASEAVEIDVSGQGSATSSDKAVIEGEPLRLAHHAVATGADGRVLIAGGCDAADPMGGCLAASARAGAYWLDVSDSESSLALPQLEVPRFGAHAVVASDAVAFVGGGFGVDGEGLATLERLEPDSPWTIVHNLPEDRPIAGLSLLDGGLVLLSDRLGAIHWWSEAGSGTLDPTSRAPSLAPISGERPMLALPGERVLVDSWLFAPATAAVDPALERTAIDALAGGGVERSGAALLGLADGTALIVGGRLAQAPEPIAEPSVLRLRPALDGPDEWIPDLAGPQTDAFVCNAPGWATVILGGLQIDGAGSVDELASVHAHVRGFRSGNFRLEFEYEADANARAQVVLGQGATSLVSVALQAGQVSVRRRAPDGTIAQLDCGLTGVEPGAALVLEVEDHARHLWLSSDELVADCELEWSSDAGVSVGFGVSGAGSARFFGLRLARR